MFRLDYISCLLTVVSTVFVGRRMWQGWVIAGANSLIICFIGLKTAQTGFIPANLFCLAVYVYNIQQWRNPAPVGKATLLKSAKNVVRLRSVHSVETRERREVAFIAEGSSQLLCKSGSRGSLHESAAVLSR